MTVFYWDFSSFFTSLSIILFTSHMRVTIMKKVMYKIKSTYTYRTFTFEASISIALVTTHFYVIIVPNKAITVFTLYERKRSRTREEVILSKTRFSLLAT